MAVFFGANVWRLVVTERLIRTGFMFCIMGLLRLLTITEVTGFVCVF